MAAAQPKTENVDLDFHEEDRLTLNEDKAVVLFFNADRFQQDLKKLPRPLDAFTARVQTKPDGKARLVLSCSGVQDYFLRSRHGAGNGKDCSWLDGVTFPFSAVASAFRALADFEEDGELTLLCVRTEEDGSGPVYFYPTVEGRFRGVRGSDAHK